MTKSEKDVYFAYCKVCQRHFSMSHAERNDVLKHNDSDIKSELTLQKHAYTILTPLNPTFIQ